VNIAGVILNNVATHRHESTLVHSIREHCGIPILGCLPKDHRASIPERTLALFVLGKRTCPRAWSGPEN